MDVSVLLLICVALIWGITNPMMKKGSEGIEKVQADNCAKGFFMEIAFLLRNYKYLTAYGLNQLGSLLYYYTLRHCELAIAGPLTNTMTFLVTYWSGRLLFGEKDDGTSSLKIIGMILVCAGITVCLYDKLSVV